MALLEIISFSLTANFVERVLVNTLTTTEESKGFELVELLEQP